MSILLRGIAIFCLTTFHLDNAFGFALKRNMPRSSHLIQRASSISDEPQLRIGHGFDIHRLIEGTKLIIGLLQYDGGCIVTWHFLTRLLNLLSGGVDVPFHVGADAHSDGDAMYHRCAGESVGTKHVDIRRQDRQKHLFLTEFALLKSQHCRRYLRST